MVCYDFFNIQLKTWCPIDATVISLTYFFFPYKLKRTKLFFMFFQRHFYEWGDHYRMLPFVSVMEIFLPRKWDSALLMGRLKSSVFVLQFSNNEADWEDYWLNALGIIIKGRTDAESYFHISCFNQCLFLMSFVRISWINVAFSEGKST